MAVASLHPIFAAKILTDYVIRYRCVNEVITSYEIFIIAQFIQASQTINDGKIVEVKRVDNIWVQS